MQFIKATNEYNTFEKHVSAPYIRKSFESETEKTAIITVAACGFYELYFNGKKITKGYFAPYINNTDDLVYFDQYTVSLQKGENVIGLCLGNGFQNNPGGYIWKFHEAPFRSAPKCAVTIEAENLKIESDQTFKTHPSPIVYDDYRYGEWYDANLECDGWCDKGFDDSAWGDALLCDMPKGELRLTEAEPIIADGEIEPVAFWEEDGSYIYDFGINNAGICKLQIEGEKGQKIELIHGEILKDGKFNIDNVCCDVNRTEYDFRFIHKDVYACKGGRETYMPTFTYHGFRYVKVTGITKDQATKDLLRYIPLHSDLKSRGGFECSHQTVNKLQQMTRLSDISCFHYFPTDCPQREKNGWTADAALSAEQMTLNFSVEKSFREWMRSVVKSQNEKGAVACVVPTGGWGYEWGSGPAWDCALVTLPYFNYIYRGDTRIIEESAEAFVRYLKYLLSRRNEKGLVAFGLGDWCHAGRAEDDPKAPLVVTDSIISFDIAKKAAFMFGVIGKIAERDFALSVAEEFKTAIRKNLIDFESMTVLGNCQTSQALALYYGIFEKSEEEKAFCRLLDFIREADDHIDCGVLGGRVIFHLLSKFGHSDLVFKMITRKDFPSYAYWIEKGATTLWECFDINKIKSCNHHFWGDISAWFIKCIAGINYNPTLRDLKLVEIKPNFVSSLDFAKGYYESLFGKIEVSWKRNGEKIELSVKIPNEINATLSVPNGYFIETENAVLGEYVIAKS